LKIGEVGDVAAKSLLHLQCHFGMDTLSRARRGARVTGAYFSPEAIAPADRLAKELGIPARSIESNVYTLTDIYEEAPDGHWDFPGKVGDRSLTFSLRARLSD
jgi:hypothetical protein